MIKLILFDQGNVFGTDEETPVLKNLVKDFNLDEKKLFDRFTELLVKAEVDEIPGKLMWETIIKEFNLPKTVDGLIQEMADAKKLYPEVMEIIKKLREKYKVAYYTNFCRDFFVIMDQFHLEDYFDYGLAAYQVKSRKPSKEGFVHILEHFGVKGEETLFIDDSEKNVNAAKELGMETIHLTDKDKLLELLKRKGIEV